jgi:sec-independent protein translocase protein TatB
MFDWNELLIIGAAALIFIGPKELPGTLRTMGKFVAKARGMARDFQTNVDDMVREAELDEVKKQVQKLEYGGFEQMIQNTVDPKGKIQDALRAPDLAATVASPQAATTAPAATEASGAVAPVAPAAPAAPASSPGGDKPPTASA